MPPSKQPPEVANLPPELVKNPQYEVLRELGRGGMGVVYLAKNKLMDRLEVLKVVNKALLDRPGSVERFLREIRSAAKLNHVNVVAAYSAVQSGDLLAFAMEYVEGEDLARLVQTTGPLPVVNACHYVQQAALGLQHAFEKQMVHRDIKPQNLILAREGKRHIVKVLDFGLAKVTRAQNDATGLTNSGVMLGTPDYISPEQTLDAANADIRSDIYSLGCTFYYLLTGAPPFRGRSLYEVLQAHQSREAEPLHLVRPEVPEELAAVVGKMMAKDPAQRYQTPMALMQALAAVVKPGASGIGHSALGISGRSVPPDARPSNPNRTVGQPMPNAQCPMPNAEARDTLTASSTKTIEPRKRRKRRPPAGNPSLKWVIGGGIAGGLVLLLLLGVLVGTVNRNKGGKKAAIGVPASTPEVKATKDGDVKGTKDGDQATRRLYLSDLEETDWSGHEWFGKNGRNAHDAPIAVNGIKYPKGLWTHPRESGDCSVKYRISGLDAVVFVTKVAINDSARPRRQTPLTFQVLGDGKVLWTAAPIRGKGQVQECRISVKDVSVLKLRVNCPGSSDFAHAVWLDPYLWLSSPINADKPGK
jgi:serine/threonine protein kinase